MQAPASFLCVLALLALALLPACSSGGDDPKPVPNQAPSVNVTTPTGEQSGDVTITYDLLDHESHTCSVTVEYSVNGGFSYSPAPEGAGGDGTTDLASSPGGTTHTFVWDSSGVAVTAYESDVRVRITPADGDTGTADETSYITVYNGTNAKPVATVTSPTGTQSGDITIDYTLADAESNTVTIWVRYSTDGGSWWNTAHEAASGSDGTSGLTSSPGGTAHVFVWDSVSDGVADVSPESVIFRIMPRDAISGQGASEDTTAFDVDNRANFRPSVTIDSTHTTETGLVFVEYTLADPQGDSCSVTVEYSTTGGTGYTACTSGPGGAPTISMNTTSGGLPYRFVWNSYAEGVALSAPNSTVRIRLTPADDYDGPAADTGDFTVDNSSIASGDPTNGTNYPLQDDPTTGAEDWRAAATDGQYLYLVGADPSGSDGGTGTSVQWVIQKRRLEDGQLDTAFGTGGTVASDPSNFDDVATAVYLYGNYFVVAGLETTTTALSGTVDLSSASTTVSGTSTQFLSELVVGNRIFANGETFRVAAITDDTTLTVDATPSSTAAGLPCDRLSQAWRLEKYGRSSGALYTFFGTAGVITGADVGEVPGPRIVPYGSHVFVVGFEETVPLTDHDVRIERRSFSTGSLYTGFGTGGVIQQDLSTGLADGLVAGLAHSSYLFLSGVHSLNAAGGGNAVAFLQKRSTSSGALETTWGTGGTYTDDASTGVDAGGAVVTDGPNVYWLTASETATADQYTWRFHKLSFTSPTTATTVSSAGALVESSPFPPVWGPMVATLTHLYALGRDGLATDPFWRLEKRALSDLSLDATFAASGVYASNPNDGTGGSGVFDDPRALLLHDGVLFLLGYEEVAPGLDTGRRGEALFD